MMESRAITLQGVQTVKLVLVSRKPGILQTEHGCQMGLRRVRVSHVLHLNMNQQLFLLFLLLLHMMVMLVLMDAFVGIIGMVAEEAWEAWEGIGPHPDLMGNRGMHQQIQS